MAEAIREVVSQAILFDVADPRVHGVTVLRVEASADLRNATVYVSIMGTDAEQRTALKGLRHGAGFLQSRVAARLQSRFTPILAFKLDDSIKKSVAISRLIDEAVAADRREAPPDPAEAVASQAVGPDDGPDVDDDGGDDEDDEDESEGG